MNKPIYLDYNATTPVDKEVLKAMIPWFTEKFGNSASRSHIFGWEAEEAVELSKKQISELIDCEPSEIYFTSGATESINLAIKGVIENKENRIEKIITSTVEHKATLDVCQYLSKSISIEHLPTDSFGNIQLESFTNFPPSNFLVSLIFANNETGNLLNNKLLNTLTYRKSIIKHTDATQAIGKIPFNFKESNFDLMSFSGHKIYGPKGIGSLIIKKGTKISTQIHGGNHQKGVRSGTLNIPGIVGLGKACEIANNNLENYIEKVGKLRTMLENELLQLPDVAINGNINNRLPNTTNLAFGGLDGERLLENLTKVAVSSGSACTSANVEPSHVLLAMGIPISLAYSSIRFSLGKDTTEKEIDIAVNQIKDVVKRLRN